jgi:hypothetical protein
VTSQRDTARAERRRTTLRCDQVGSAVSAAYRRR